MGAFLTFVGLVVVAVIWWRRLSRTRDTVTAVLKRLTLPDKRLTPPAKRPAQTLERDPKTGVYRVKGDGK